MIRGGKKLYGDHDDDASGHETPDFTVYASAIDFRDKLRVDSSSTSPKSISSSVITRYLNSLQQPDLAPSSLVQTTATHSVKAVPKSKPALSFSTVTLTVNPENTKHNPDTISPTLRNSNSKYNYHLEDNYPEPEDADTVPPSPHDIELIDLDYYDPKTRLSRSTPEARNDATLAKHPAPTKKPRPPANTPTKKRSSSAKLSSSTRAKPPTALLTISSFKQNKEPTLHTPTDSPHTENSSPPPRLSRSLPAATPNTLLKRVSARPTTPTSLTSRPSSSASTRSSSPQIRPSTASSSTSSRSTATKKSSSKPSTPLPELTEEEDEEEPASPSELLTTTVRKYLNTEYFSDEDEYRNLPTNTEALSEKQISVLVRAVTLDLDLFMLCYFDDYSRNILNKRMSLATKETSLSEKMENNITHSVFILLTLTHEKRGSECSSVELFRRKRINRKGPHYTQGSSKKRGRED